MRIIILTVIVVVHDQFIPVALLAVVWSDFGVVTNLTTIFQVFSFVVVIVVVVVVVVFVVIVLFLFFLIFRIFLIAGILTLIKYWLKKLKRN